MIWRHFQQKFDRVDANLFYTAYPVSCVLFMHLYQAIGKESKTATYNASEEMIAIQVKLSNTVTG